MNKIKLIIAREYLTRVKKKSFIIMTILGPVLFALLTLMPILIQKFSEKETSTILIIDEAPHVFTTRLASTKEIRFINDSVSVKEAKLNFDKYNDDAILYLPDDYIKKSHLI
ncbi:MAG: ABC transporter permease, partial [Bacteroidota bacterium]